MTHENDVFACVLPICRCYLSTFVPTISQKAHYAPGGYPTSTSLLVWSGLQIY